MKEDLTNPSALHDELQNNAMQLFKFDKDDLPFNRDGKLSNKQVQRFIFETRKFTGVFIFSGLLLAGLFILSWLLFCKELPNGMRYLRWGGDGEAVQPEKG